MATLTLAEAERILQAAKAKAEELGIKLSISVVDPRGDLIAMVRMDGAPWRTGPVSQGKAFASASFGRTSGEMAGADNAVIRSLIMMEGGRLIPHQGAVPIRKDGELVGAVGGSGAPSEKDEEACLAGVAAL